MNIIITVIWLFSLHLLDIKLCFCYPFQNHPHKYNAPFDTSNRYHLQDNYGNYGFGYHSHTVTGDGNYRYERKKGAETNGGYGFSNHNGKVNVDFYEKPKIDLVAPVAMIPVLHQPIDDRPSYQRDSPSEPAHHGEPFAASSNLVAPKFFGPRYHSYYDVRIPQSYYKRKNEGLVPSASEINYKRHEPTYAHQPSVRRYFHRYPEFGIVYD